MTAKEEVALKNICFTSSRVVPLSTIGSASLRLRGARIATRCRLKEGMEHRLPVANASSIRQLPPSAEGREKQQWHRLKEEATTAGVSAALRIGDNSGEPEIHPTSTVSNCRSTTTTVEHLSAVSLSSQ
nr:hypothetical protein Itr_chr09CG17110 [Ipomoea trifida]